MDARICKALNYIENNLSLKLTLNELSEVACMSPSYFHRVFKKETGRTPFEFIEEIKISKAYALLILGSHKVYELTELFGYSDYETFTRAFKKHYTLAPDDLKAIAQKIKSDMNVGPEGFLIKVFEVDNISEVTDKLKAIFLDLKSFLIEKGYSEEDINKAKVMSIMPKFDNNSENQNTIKNKFVIAEDQKIWEALLNHR